MNTTKAINRVEILGELLDTPVERELPNGTAFISFTVVVPAGEGPATSVPVTWFEPPTRVQKWAPGDQIGVIGAIARRFFRFQGRTVPVTEVRVDGAELVRHKARFKKLVASAA